MHGVILDGGEQLDRDADIAERNSPIPNRAGCHRSAPERWQLLAQRTHLGEEIPVLGDAG